MELRASSLGQHLVHQHGIYSRPLDPLSRRLFGQPGNYTVSMNQDDYVPCLVPDCDGRAKQRNAMRNHFRDRHPKDILRIEEEGDEPFPKCPLCLKHINPKYQWQHNNSSVCIDNQDRGRRMDANLHMHEMKDL
jgi:hypothetical protein